VRLTLADEDFCVQGFFISDGEISFEKRKETGPSGKSKVQFRVELFKDGNLFFAEDLPQELYEIFLSRIKKGQIVNIIEDLVILLS